MNTWLKLTRDTVKGLIEFGAECVDWMIRRDFARFQLTGNAAHDPATPLRVTFHGRASVCNDIAQLYFHKTPEILEETRFARALLPYQPPAGAGTDIVLTESPPWRHRAPQGAHLHQTLTESLLDLSAVNGSWEEQLLSQNIRRTLKQAERLGIKLRWSESPPDMVPFYENLLKPSALALHEEAAFIPPLSFFQRLWTPRGLLLAEDETGALTGGLLIQKSRFAPWRLLRIGLSDKARADTKLRNSVNALLTRQAIAECVAQGQRRISFGLSSAAKNSGGWRHKEFWGGAAGHPLDHYPRCIVQPLSPTGQAALDALNIFVIRDHRIVPSHDAPDASSTHENLKPSQSADESQREAARTMKHLGKATVIGLALGLLLRLILPRALGPEKLGILYFCESLGAMFFTFLPLGLATYITREIPADHSRASRILPTIVPAQALWGFLLWLSMMTFLVATGTDRLTISCAIFMGIYSGIMYFQRSILRRSYLALGQSALTARNDVQVRVALVLMVIIALSAGASIVWVSACYALSEIGGLVYLLRLSKRLGHFEQPFSAHFLHEIVLSSLPFFAVGALIEIYGNVDTAMLRYFGGNHEVAYYGAALRLKGIGLMLIPVMHASVQPVLSRLWKHDRAAFRTMVSNWMRILLAISLPMTLGMMAVPDLISDLLFGSEFQASHRTISYLAPVLSLTYLNVLMGSCLSISSDGKSFLKITALSVVINILLNLVMIPFGDSLWGEGGGPAGSSLATVISEIFVLVSMRRIFREGLDHGQLRWNMIYLLIPCLALGLAYPWLPWINPWARLALMLSLTPIYMALTHIARPAEIRHALSLLRKH